MPEQFEKVIFTADLLRIDETRDNRAMNPQSINIDWLRTLLANQISSCLHLPVDSISLDDFDKIPNRLSIYRDLDIPFTPVGWASIYESLDSPEIEQQIASLFRGALVIGFELPPWMIAILSDHAITYIDFCIHPIRFLDDYIFGVRTNNIALRHRIQQLMLNQDDVRASALLLSARARRRLFYNKEPQHGAALFVGQMPIDSSLIAHGRILDMKDVYNGLRAAQDAFGRVYYKIHPHRKDVSQVKDAVSKLNGVHIIDMNIYDLLGSGRLGAVFSLSSSSLIEATYFGLSCRRLSPRNTQFLTRDEHADSAEYYIPVQPAILDERAWNFIFGQDESLNIQGSPFSLSRGILKESLNMKWGR